MKRFEIILHVAERDLLDTLAANKDVVYSMRQIDAVEAKVPRRTFQYAGGKRLKGITATKLVEEIFSDSQPHTLDDIQSAFTRRNFAKNSCAPALSRAMATKQIKRIGDNIYIAYNAMPLLRDDVPSLASADTG